DLKEINNSLFNTINENFSKVKNVIDGSKSPSWSNISINNLLDFFIHTSSGNPKSTIGFEAGENGAFSFIYGDGLNNGGRIDVSTEGEINGKTAKSDLVNWLTNNKRHNLNVKPKQGQPESITTRNPAYIRYLIENN